MYLMKTIAIGEQSVPFLEDIDELTVPSTSCLM